MYGNSAASADLGGTANNIKIEPACDPVTGTVHRPGKPIVKVS